MRQNELTIQSFAPFGASHRFRAAASPSRRLQGFTGVSNSLPAQTAAPVLDQAMLSNRFVQKARATEHAKIQSLQELNDLMIAHGHRHACAFASLTESLELSLVHLSPIDLGLLLDELAKARLRRVERVSLRCRSRRKHQWTTAYIRTCFSCLFNDLIHCAVLLSGWCAPHVDRGQELRRMLQVERELER